jgi:D-lactate dehydrogenase (cytochrome)
VDLSGMNRIIAVNADDFDVVVQPGVTREDLNSYLRDTGLFFPIDPGANASIGGMVSTRASGTNAVRYGTMASNVRNLTAVLADGSIVKTGQRAPKSSAGYDLTHLLIGAEGTLGIVTEITLRLHGIPEAMAAAICSFPGVGSACEAATLCMQAGIPIARIELMDTGCVQAVNALAGLGLPEQPLLLLEFHGTRAGVKEQAELFGELATAVGGGSFEWVGRPEARTRLWKARHQLYFAMQTIVPGKRPIPTDACVPISRLADCVTETAADLAASDLFGPILGHVGDGNFHVALYVDLDDADEVTRAEGALERLSERAIAMDGTCTGEHGVGQGKRRYMRREHGAGVDMMLRIKRALDPDNILNPGKVLPD